MNPVGPAFGRVVKLSYRDQQPKLAADTSAFVVTFRGPDGSLHEHPIENGDYLLDNRTLQFMAVNGIKPTDIESPSMRVEDWTWLVPIAESNDGYGLAQMAFSGGRAALRNAEWFGAADDENDADGDDNTPNDGGGPDPSTGNQGAVDTDTDNSDETGVTAELTPDKDTGINITIE